MGADLDLGLGRCKVGLDVGLSWAGSSERWVELSMGFLVKIAVLLAGLFKI